MRSTADGELLGADGLRPERNLQELGEGRRRRMACVGAHQPVAAKAAADDEAGLIEANHLTMASGQRDVQAFSEIADPN